MASPLVSVVVPTAGRPSLLRRAIESCLSGDFSNETEVIVVANGWDMSWCDVRDAYALDGRVCFIYTAIADQNVARNIGIESAHGELIRFLDDDDFLFPEVAAQQYRLALEENLDFCSASISLQDQEGNWLGDIAQRDTESGLIAALAYDRIQIPFAHVYRRHTLEALRWPSGMRQSEDIVWLISYVAARERKWAKLDCPVGVWYQHDKPRLSLNRPAGFVHEPTVRALLTASEALKSQGRWNKEVACVIGAAIWECVHRAFIFRPLFWTGVAIQAQKLEPSCRPSAPVYRYPLFSGINPVFLQWLFFPKRLIMYCIEYIRAMRQGWDYRRHL